MMSREEFIADVRARALEIARAGDLQHAVAILAIEINRRQDTKIHHAQILAGTMRAMADDKDGVIRWIESVE